MGAGGIAATVGPFPAIHIAVGDAEDDANVAQDGDVGGDTVQQPMGQRAVIERAAEALGAPAEQRVIRRGGANHGPRIGPMGRVMAAHPGLAAVVFVRVVPGQQEGHLKGCARSDAHRGRHGAVDGAAKG